jgi:hypothetical protein
VSLDTKSLSQSCKDWLNGPWSGWGGAGVPEGSLDNRTSLRGS